jgi:hypothetical protein
MNSSSLKAGPYDEMVDILTSKVNTEKYIGSNPIKGNLDL